MLVGTEGQIKLCDFGSCGGTMPMETTDFIPSGSSHYFPPEHTKTPREWDPEKADMWALGVSLLEITIGKHPHPLAWYPCQGSYESDGWELSVPITHISSDTQTLLRHL